MLRTPSRKLTKNHLGETFSSGGIVSFRCFVDKKEESPTLPLVEGRNQKEQDNGNKNYGG